MKKINKKGFVLAETIAVSTVVLTSLVIIYTQFISISNSYNRSFKYNNVNNLYLVENIRQFLINDNSLNRLITSLENGQSYIDMTSCSNDYFTEYIYCETLFNYSNAKTVLFTKEDITNLKNTIDNTNYSQNLKSFIKNINNSIDNNYRLIVEFNDDTFATIKVKV